MKKLATVYEVIERTPLKRGTSPTELCIFLDCEVDSLEECLGDYYDTLIEDLTETDGVEDWNADSTYEEGERVIFCGECFERNKNTEEEENDPSPYCSNLWHKCEKFKTPCHNKIWDALCDYIAWEVFAQAIPFLHINTDDGGVMLPESDRMGGVGADQSWLNYYIKLAKRMCGKKLSRLKKNIEKLCDNGVCPMFKSVKFISDICNENCDEDSKLNEGAGVAWKH